MSNISFERADGGSHIIKTLIFEPRMLVKICAKFKSLQNEKFMKIRELDGLSIDDFNLALSLD